tara:strand:- start:4308 stop:4538 length:231 start_codon:yes stop_codon:yes gene_type:complete
MRTPAIEPKPIEWVILLIQVMTFGLALAMALITRDRSEVLENVATSQSQIIENQRTVMDALARIEAKQTEPGLTNE